MKRKAYIAIHHSKAPLKCIVRQPSILNFIKGPPHNLHTNFTGSYIHFAWNRAKSCDVLGMACSGLGQFRFSSAVPGDFAIHFPVQVLCSPAILLSFPRGIHMTWKVFCMASSAYNLYVNIKLWRLWFGGAADLDSFMFGNFGFLQTALHPALAYIQLYCVEFI